MNHNENEFEWADEADHRDLLPVGFELMCLDNMTGFGMHEYENFIETKALADMPSGFECGVLNDQLFPFQRAIVKWALRRGRAAIFADTGLGKTAMQCEWARRVYDHTGKNVLILAPLCVAHQTVKEAAKFGITVHYCREQSQVLDGITITNYEMMDAFDFKSFAGLVLDESSIIKHQDSKTRGRVIDLSREIPYRLACTATPAPNDYMELGNHAEFLGVMTAVEMLAMFFIHDGGDTSQWRLKGHGKGRFWEWLASWAVCIRKPSDLGFDDAGYNLPPINIHSHIVESETPFDADLFPKEAQTLMERRQAQRASLMDRCKAIAAIVNASDEEWIIWCHLNDESDALEDLIADAIAVSGSDSIDAKESRLDDFAAGKLRVLVTKPKIAGFGLNWQHCRNVAFVGLSDSFESYYQAVRRCYRFGQQREVHVHLVSAQAEGAVKSNLERKEAQAIEMSKSMVSHMHTIMQREITGMIRERTTYKRDAAEGNGWTLHLADCVDLTREIESGSIDYTIFSPPFASLYTYSNMDRDMGNCKNHDTFYQQFRFLVPEMLRITRPGRLLSFHCMNLPTSKQNDGLIGIRDFRGELIRMFVDAGWIYHSEVCIWKDPVTAMQRTKALGLLHKTIRKDSAMSRQGIPDYLVTMRKPGENNKPIDHTHEQFPVSLWQRYASPVWFDINPSRTLNRNPARDNDDERHICPLQLDVIERAMELWTAPDDMVFSPFAGIGSEGYVALQMGRRFIGSELKPSYFNIAQQNLADAKVSHGELFANEAMK